MKCGSRSFQLTVLLSVERTAAGRCYFPQTQVVTGQALCRFSSLKNLQLGNYHISERLSGAWHSPWLTPSTCLRQQKHGQGRNGLRHQGKLWRRWEGPWQRHRECFQRVAWGQVKSGLWYRSDGLASSSQALAHQKWETLPPTTCTRCYMRPPCAWISVVIDK